MSIAEYIFLRKECISSRLFTDVSQIQTVGSVKLIQSSPTTAACLPSNGVRSFSSSDIASSIGTISKLKNAIGSNGFTVECWIQVNETFAAFPRPILSIVNSKLSTGVSENTCSDFQVT